MDAKTKKVAVLIDAENVSLRYLDRIFERAKSEGYVCFKRIYGNVVIRKNGVNPLLEYGITHIQCYSYVPDKNTADMVLAVDAMEQLYKNGVDVFCIVSSDSDFAPLVNKIIEEGRTVIGMGESKAVKSFQNSCNEFVLLDEGEENITPFDQVKADIEALLIANEAPMRFTMISAKLGKKYLFDPENYDCDTMVELIEKMGFEVTYKSNFGKRTYYASMPKEEEETVDEAETDIVLTSETEETEMPEPAEEPVEAVETENTEATTVARLASVEEIAEPAPVEIAEEIETIAAEPVAETEQTDTEAAAVTEPTPMEILSEHLADVMKKGANTKGYMRLTAAVTALQKRIPEFSAKKYGFSNATKLFEALGCEIKDKGTSNTSIKLGRALSAEEQKELSPDLAELQKRFSVLYKELADKDGWCMLSKLIMELKAQDASFSTKAYGAKNSVALVELLPAVQLEKRYANRNNRGSYDAYIKVDIEETAEAEKATEAETAENTEATAPEEVTEIETEAEAAAEVPEAETEITEETVAALPEETDEAPETEETSDEQEFSKNGMPLYVDLPDAIDTKEQLRNAIIFILSTESVTSATRLSAPLKRYYPDFKIKNYGHNKMKSLLEELGLFVF